MSVNLISEFKIILFIKKNSFRDGFPRTIGRPDLIDVDCINFLFDPIKKFSPRILMLAKKVVFLITIFISEG